MHTEVEAEALAANLRVLSALHQALDLLSALPVVVFKGPLLTARAYGRLGARASGDNDVWLPAPACAEALERLLLAGYRAAPYVDPRAALERRGQVALWPDGDLEQVSLDLHARPFARPYFEVRDAVLLAHLETDVGTGRPIQTFDRPLSFCHAVAHWVQHHLPDGHLDLINRLWLANVGEGRDDRGPLDWEAASDGLRGLVVETCGRASVELVLERSAQIAGRKARVPAERRAREVARVLAYFDGSPPGVVRKFCALYLTAPERLLEGAWGAAFPSAAVLHEQYGPGRRPWLLLRHLARVLGER